MTGPWRPNDDGRVDLKPPPERSVHRAPLLGPRALETASDRQRITDRVRLLEALAVVLVLALLLGFWQTQVIHGSEYASLAEDNLWKRSRVRPSRGLILDRNGEILATNRPSYEVALIRELIDDEEETLRWLSAVLQEPHEVLRQRLDRQRSMARFRPVVVASGVPKEHVVRIEARQLEHPGVAVQIHAQRFYPRGATAAHVLGYVGEISPRQLESRGDRFSLGDIVGQLGVESIYNNDLAGQAGSRLAVVNSVGREIRLESEAAPLPGETVILALDVELQERVEELLGSRRGAAVVLDTTTGGVLALASSPAFDPNDFADRFSVDQWESLLRDPDKPLHNRSVRAGQPPGSVFKLVLATAGIEEGIISSSTTFFCPGGKTLYGRFFSCEGQHGNVNVVEALARSCNSFFYELGVKLGRERIVRWAQSFGLGATSGIDLTEEQGGIVPSDEWLAANGRRYYPGETVSLSIGQGPLAVSPLQLANVAATAATGFIRQPRLLMRIEGASSGGMRSYSSDQQPAPFGNATRELVARGMAGSVAYGSSWRARHPTVAVGGKTGTAQVASTARVAAEDEDRPEHLRNHAWFVAAAPIDDPEVAVAVYLENGGSGGGAAAPIGGEILASYFGEPLEEGAVRRLPIGDPADVTEPTIDADPEGNR
ncbi:MAG TPA: penicillin-binding protein 2 [Acidobacteriota bacterium]|nr:penicillin-binding protein 2 [Acidobacteriota bacterium]